MKLCIAGKNQIAVDVLEAAAALPDVTLLCLPTAADKGDEAWQPSLFSTAQRLNVPVVSLEQLYEQTDLLFLSVEYDRIIRPDRFAPSTRLFNLHFSLLPKYRGCNTAIWPILNGETEHGVTLHVIDPGVDTGDIIAQRSFPMEEKTARDLYFACMSVGYELCRDYLPRLLAGDYVATPQDLDSGSTYKRRDLDFSKKVIDFDQMTVDVLRHIRAFTFPEYQLPVVEGLSIIGAHAVSSGDAPDGADDVIRRQTADGMVELKVTANPPPPIALQQRGY